MKKMYFLLTTITVVGVYGQYVVEDHSDSCPDGFTQIRNSCYKFQHRMLTYDAADTECRRHLSTLVVLDSEEEEKALLEQYDWTQYWIGLRDYRSCGGERDFLLWLDGYCSKPPINGYIIDNPSKTCGYAKTYGHGYYLQFAKCDDRKDFVCCNGNSSPNDCNHCSHTNTKKTWIEAVTACKEAGKHLRTITDCELHNPWISWSNEYWLGLVLPKKINKDFHWEYLKVTNYQNWARDKLTGYGNCIYASGNGWMESPCDHQRPSICEFHISEIVQECCYTHCVEENEADTCTPGHNFDGTIITKDHVTPVADFDKRVNENQKKIDRLMKQRQRMIQWTTEQYKDNIKHNSDFEIEISDHGLVYWKYHKMTYDTAIAYCRSFGGRLLSTLYTDELMNDIRVRSERTYIAVRPQVEFKAWVGIFKNGNGWITEYGNPINKEPESKSAVTVDSRASSDEQHAAVCEIV